MHIFKGCGVAMATPFSQSGINYAESEKLLEFLIAGGQDALIVLGTTGEASTMSAEEKRDYIKFVVQKTQKRVPVIVGTGANNTVTAIQLSKQAEDLGADALLIVTPYYNKCTQSGAIEHYNAIASRVSLPIIVYNVPGRTGFNLLPETALKLSEINNIKAIKEASGNMNQIQRLLQMKHKNFDVYAGDDGLTAAAMLMGAVGVISVAANIIPALMHALTFHCLHNDWQKAAEIQRRILPLVDQLFVEVNPIPVKKALELIGIDAGLPRLPLTEMEADNAARLKKELAALELI